MDCIFCKIVNGQIPSTKIFEDEKIIAINDINPSKPVHILFIPKEHIDDFESLTDDSIFPSIRNASQKFIEEKELLGKGYKILVNGGGAQVINHLHFHLVGPIGKNAAV